MPVARRLTRKIRITSDGEQAALHRLVLERAHRRRGCSVDWSNEMASFTLGGTPRRLGIAARTASTTRDGVGARLLEHAQVDAALAVDAHDLRSGPAVPSSTSATSRDAHRRRRSCPASRRRPRRTTTSLERARLRRPACWRRRCSRGRPARRLPLGSSRFDVAHRVDHVEDAEAARPQRVALDLDLDLARSCRRRRWRWRRRGCARAAARWCCRRDRRAASRRARRR